MEIILTILTLAGAPADWSCQYEGHAYTLNDLAKAVHEELGSDEAKAEAFVALMWAESRFKCGAKPCLKWEKRKKGNDRVCKKWGPARGLLQWVPNPKTAGLDPMNPLDNVKGGVIMVNAWMGRRDGSWNLLRVCNYMSGNSCTQEGERCAERMRRKLRLIHSLRGPRS